MKLAEYIAYAIYRLPKGHVLTYIDFSTEVKSATSVTHKLIMVTNNTNHFKSISGIELEDWAKA